MRPKYETQADLDNEKEVCGFLSKVWDCVFHKLNPIKYKVDFLIEKGDHYGWAELKCLNINYGQFPFMIS